MIMTIFIENKAWAYQYVVSTNGTDVFNGLISLFGYESSKDILDSGKTVMISIRSADNYYNVHYNGKTTITNSPVQTVYNIIFEEAIYHPFLFPLHGGAIEANGQAHLFLAPTHAGKTTLIAYLTQQGYPYINDDRILIDMDTLRVIPDAAPIHLRPESIPVLEQYECSITGKEIQVENIHRIVYSPENTVSSELQIGNIFFIERSQTENVCQTIQRDEAVRLLMAGLLSPKAYDGNRLKCAIRLASKCKRLVYSDMRYVADLLEKEKFQ